MAGRERMERGGFDAEQDNAGDAHEPDAVLAARRPSLDPSLGTEMLLNAVIVECHRAVRNLAIPLAAGAPDPYACRSFLSEVVSLAQAGALVGKTVAMLRAADRFAEAGAPDQIKILPVIEKNG